MASTRDIYATTFIRQQHDLIRELFDAVEKADADERSAAFEPLVRLLAVHETAEEMVIYPAAKGGEAGKEIVEQRKAEEDEAKKVLAELETMDPTSREFGELFAQFRIDVMDHAEAEELEIFPLLTEVADTDQLKQMTEALKVAEGMAPTHAHKLAPESAVGNLLVGPFVAMADRVRDALHDARKSRDRMARRHATSGASAMWAGLLIDALATYRLTRLATADVISEPARMAVVRRAGAEPAPDLEHPTAQDVVEAIADPPKLATLVTCRWCAGIWIAAGVSAARVFRPGVWDPVARGLALSTAAVLLAELEDA